MAVGESITVACYWFIMHLCIDFTFDGTVVVITTKRNLPQTPWPCHKHALAARQSESFKLDSICFVHLRKSGVKNYSVLTMIAKAVVITYTNNNYNVVLFIQVGNG